MSPWCRHAGTETVRIWAVAIAAGTAAIAVAGYLLTHGRPASDLPEELQKRLGSLGYVEEVTEDPDATRAGVVTHDSDAAHAGVNAYCSTRSREIHLLDMAGEILHTLHLPEAGDGSDCMLEPLGDGRFLALAQPNLVKLGWDSEVVWTSGKRHHHDVAVASNGDIYTLSERPGTLVRGGSPLPIRDHAIVILDANGRLRREIGLAGAFASRIPGWRLGWMRRLQRRDEPGAWPYELASDAYHPNTLQILDRDGPLGRAGDVLICLREMSLVAVVDPATGAIRWSWGPGYLKRPHHPSLLENGNLLIFDNGFGRGWSRIVELDPAKRRIVWSYEADPRESFFSDVRGSAQALPNGNVLITESTKGRVFEITRGGEIVWEFWNPERTEDGTRRQIYRMVRLGPTDLAGAPWLEEGLAARSTR